MTAGIKGGGSQPPSDRLLSAKEAADYLGISLKRLYAFCNDGSLRHLRLAGTTVEGLRFRRLWLDSWAEGNATSGAASAPTTSRKPRRPPRYRYWITARYDTLPSLRTLATARTLAEAVALAAVQTEKSLLIYDTYRGNFLVVWRGAPSAAADPMLRATCSNCGHLGVEHRYPFTDPRTRHWSAAVRPVRV